jgi:FMN-dependent NADH-azoreductase
MEIDMTDAVNAKKVLLVSASARKTGSISRDLASRLLAQFGNGGQIDIVERDVAEGLPFVNENWVGANFTDPGERSDEQRETLALSDSLVQELRDADAIVIASPIYNFGIPASLKAWIDLIARARETFYYTPEGPVGLLTGKKAFLVLASGGTRIGSEIDFASGYLRHMLGFVGIDDVEVVAAAAVMADPEAIAGAQARIGEVAAGLAV